jgi:hypothetical protein
VERFNKRNTRNTNHQRNQNYSQLNSSDNEVSEVLPFRASPNAFAPSAPITMSTDTPECRDPNTNSAKNIAMDCAVGKVITSSPQSHSIHGSIDRASPQSTLNSPTSGALHALQTKGTQKHQSPTKPRLLTKQIQPQPRQRDVALQRVTQCIRSFIADLIAYKRTPSVEKSEHEFSKTVPMGDAVGKVIATNALDTRWY